MLTILNVAYPLCPVGPEALGGAEQVLSAIDRALVSAGHRSLVIARGDSTVAGELVPLAVRVAPFDHATYCAAHDDCRGAIARTLAREDVDLVHLHGTDFPCYVPAGRRTMATLHLWPDWYPAATLRSCASNLVLQCVSEAQRHACPHPDDMLMIPNGVDLARWQPNGGKADYALTLGRICPEKGVHLAIDAAERAGCPLRIAGPVLPFANHVAYFEDRIAPRTSGRVQFLGAVTGRAKYELLASARCLLLPSTVIETSSLVAMEALACGTPVIAFGSPALAELIEDGRSGFLVSNAEEMADAIGAAGRLSPQDCRRTAIERCDLHRMTGGYLRTYEALTRSDRDSKRTDAAALASP